MNPLKRPVPSVRLAAALGLLPTLALAHDGHGAGGAHWHATDASGFVAIGLVFAAGVWWSRRK